MPIRAEFRHLYRGPEWQATRARILKRAGNQCEQCGKPGGVVVFSYTWRVRVPGAFGTRQFQHFMIWMELDGFRHWWRTQGGAPVSLWAFRGLPRRVFVVLTVAHLDHNPYNMAAENLAALCPWCHLHHDSPFHKESRELRKDRGRPMLEAGV